MGKSLRSKTKVKFRNIKRNSGVFGKVADERARRLAQKLGTLGGVSVVVKPDEESASGQAVEETSSNEGLTQDQPLQAEKQAADDEMAVDSAQPNRPSTSGWNKTRKGRKKNQSKSNRRTIAFKRR